MGICCMRFQFYWNINLNLSNQAIWAMYIVQWLPREFFNQMTIIHGESLCNSTMCIMEIPYKRWDEFRFTDSFPGERKTTFLCPCNMMILFVTHWIQYTLWKIPYFTGYSSQKSLCAGKFEIQYLWKGLAVFWQIPLICFFMSSWDTSWKI